MKDVIETVVIPKTLLLDVIKCCDLDKLGTTNIMMLGLLSDGIFKGHIYPAS